MIILLVCVMNCVILVAGRTIDTQRKSEDMYAHVPHVLLPKIRQWIIVLENGQCGFPMFTCKWTGICLHHLRQLCDGVRDCRDGEDETHCTHQDKEALWFLERHYGYTHSPHLNYTSTSYGEQSVQTTTQTGNTSAQRTSTGLITVLISLGQLEYI